MKVAVNKLSKNGIRGALLDEICFEVAQGQCLVVSGNSGSGKSLLLDIISGLVQPDSGQVLFNQQDLRHMNKQQESLFRKQLSVIFQVPALLSNLTLFENLALPLLQHNSHLSYGQRQHLIIKACSQFNLQHYLDERVEQLTNGSQSLASLARALITDPQLLLWDTALSGIDLKWQSKIITTLKNMKQEKKTLILFTNKQRLIDDIADVHLHLENTRISTSCDLN